MAGLGWAVVGAALIAAQPPRSTTGAPDGPPRAPPASASAGAISAKRPPTAVTAAVSAAPSAGAVGGPVVSGPATASAAAVASCPPVPACDAAPPAPPPPAPWTRSASRLVAGSGSPNHRGRDLFLRAGDPQWILAKLAYGALDKDLEGETVDVWLLRGCGTSWEQVGAATTTRAGEHAVVEGVEDDGGRVYFEIPPSRRLDVGRHRAHLVVRGDATSTDVYLEVLAPGAALVVSDVDGTLTEDETDDFARMLEGTMSPAHPDAATVLGVLAAKGYRPLYLTARPERLVARTRRFLAGAGFPPGILHTTLSATGAVGTGAYRFKAVELAAVAAKGLVPAFGFGNMESDTRAYDEARIAPPGHRFFYRQDDAHGGRRIESYGELLTELGALAPACR